MCAKKKRQWVEHTQTFIRRRFNTKTRQNVQTFYMQKLIKVRRDVEIIFRLGSVISVYLHWNLYNRLINRVLKIDLAFKRFSPSKLKTPNKKKYTNCLCFAPKAEKKLKTKKTAKKERYQTTTIVLRQVSIFNVPYHNA